MAAKELKLWVVFSSGAGCVGWGDNRSKLEEVARELAVDNPKNTYHLMESVAVVRVRADIIEQNYAADAPAKLKA